MTELTSATVWMVMTVFGKVAGGMLTSGDMAYCEDRVAIEAPNAIEIILEEKKFSGRRVRQKDIKVFCADLRRGTTPPFGKRFSAL